MVDVRNLRHRGDLNREAGSQTDNSIAALADAELNEAENHVF